MSFITDIQELGTLIQETGNEKLFERYLEVLDEAIDINSENMKLRKENKELKEKLTFENQIRFENDAIWLEVTENGQKGPYCPKCYDVRKQLIHLVKDGKWCPNCQFFRGELPAGKIRHHQ